MLFACDGAGEAGFAAGGGVLFDHTTLCGFVDSFVGCGKIGFCGLFVVFDDIKHAFNCLLHGTLAAHVEYALALRNTNSLFGCFCDCHNGSDTTLKTWKTQYAQLRGHGGDVRMTVWVL